MFQDFESFDIQTDADVTIHGVRKPGNGPALLLVHGYPESHRIWRYVADQLSSRFSVVAIDLRGYGKSSAPTSYEANHATYGKSAMARDCVTVMQRLGYSKFYFVGHDRGARVGHRLCVSYCDVIIKAIFLDICPTLTMYESTNLKFASAYYHWFFLIQPTPGPEKLIVGNPRAFIESHMGSRYAGMKPFDPQDVEAYIRAIGEPDRAHAMCEDYRASATIDLDEHRADNQNGSKITVPLKVLWGKHGVIEECFDALTEWSKVATNVQGHSLDCGHYIPEEIPQVLLQEISSFFFSV
jgi:haloacetate dehalogenase